MVPKPVVQVKRDVFGQILGTQEKLKLLIIQETRHKKQRIKTKRMLVGGMGPKPMPAKWTLIGGMNLKGGNYSGMVNEICVLVLFGAASSRIVWALYYIAGQRKHLPSSRSRNMIKVDDGAHTCCALALK